MAQCETCGNEYDRTFEVHMGGKVHTFDSLECAAHALAVREPYGVWGGLTEDEREAMLGRPRHRLVVNSQ